MGISRQRSKLTHFFPTNITPSHNLGITLNSDFKFRKDISLTCRSCFYHISLSDAKTIATALITNRLDYCNSLLYNTASKDILKLHCVQNCLARVVTRSPRFSHCLTPKISSLVPCSISHNFQTLYRFLSNLRIYFPCFLEHPNPESSVHLVFTCCLFLGLKLVLGLMLFSCYSYSLEFTP